MSNKYRNRPDMNKTGGNAIRLKLTNLQPALKNLAINTIARFALVGISFIVWASSFNPLLGLTRSRGRCWAAKRLSSHHPEPSGRAAHGRAMDWTLEDNMVDGLFFCAKLTSRRRGHASFV